MNRERKIGLIEKVCFVRFVKGKHRWGENLEIAEWNNTKQTGLCRMFLFEAENDEPLFSVWETAFQTWDFLVAPPIGRRIFGTLIHKLKYSLSISI